MAETKSGQKTPKKRVTFAIEAPGAKEVDLVGDFNHWTPKKHPMAKDKNGTWKKALMLEPNVYEYKFLVDGEWRQDVLNSRTRLNCFGTVNNILQLS